MANPLTQQFEGMYAAQTAIIGAAVLVTLGAYAIGKRAVLTAIDAESMIVPGGDAMSGGWQMLMLRSDMTAEPPKGTAVTITGHADIPTGMMTISTKANGPTMDITIGDFAAMT